MAALLKLQRETRNTGLQHYGVRVMGAAKRKRGTNVRPRTNVIPITDREAAQKFSALVIAFPAGQLAQAAARTKDSAKGWKKARAFPSGASLINMCRAIPSVYEWLQTEIEHGGEVFESDRNLTLAYQETMRLASTPGKRGDEARKMLADMARLAAKGGE